MSKSETLRCGQCERPLINRIVDKCLYCGESVPAELLLSEDEKDRILAAEMKQLESDRQARKVAEQEKRKAIQAEANSVDFGIFFM